jgi:hypothetical protein
VHFVHGHWRTAAEIRPTNPSAWLVKSSKLVVVANMVNILYPFRSTVVCHVQVGQIRSLKDCSLTTKLG